MAKRKTKRSTAKSKTSTRKSPAKKKTSKRSSRAVSASAENRLAHKPLDVIPLEERAERPRGSSEVPAHLAADNRRQQNTKEYARRVQNAR